MFTYMVEYVLDRTLKEFTMLVSADDYTKAYFSALFALPRSATILKVTVI